MSRLVIIVKVYLINFIGKKKKVKTIVQTSAHGRTILDMRPRRK